MVEYERTMGRVVTSERLSGAISVTSAGIILASFVVSSSPMLGDFALVSVASTWLYTASFVCGFALGSILDEVRAIVYGVCLMALIAVMLFSTVLIFPALLGRSPFLDIALLVAFQQSFPRFIFICILGYMGAFLSALVKLYRGQL